MKLTPQRTVHPVIRAFFMGSTGTGKSGSTVPLAIEGPIKGCPAPGEGFELRILDFDAKYTEMAYAVLDDMVEKQRISQAQRDEALARIDVVECKDKTGVLTQSAGSGRTAKQVPVFGVKGTPTGWTVAVKQLDKWSASMSPDHILIIDSFTHAATVAVSFWQDLNGLLNEELLWQQFSGPQQLLAKFMIELANLSCNVIVCAHQTIHEIYRKTGEKDPTSGKESEELLDVVVVPISVGKAGSMQLPNRFNHLLIAGEEGAGRASTRYLHTRPFKGIMSKSPFFGKAKDRYLITTGWVEYFALRKS